MNARMRVIPVKVICQLSFASLLLAICVLIFFVQPQKVLCSKDHNDEVVKVGVGFFPPWISAENGVVKGYDYDLLRHIFSRMGVKADFVPMQFSNILKGLEIGDIDITASLFFREERNVYIRFISPPYRTRSTINFYTRKVTGTAVSKYIDIAGMRVGVSEGAKYFPTFDLDDRMIKVAYSSPPDCFNALVAGEVDVVVCSGSTGTYYIKELGLTNYVKSCEFKYAPKLMPVYLGISRKSHLADRADEISTVVRSLQKTGILDELALKHSVIVN